jgi:tRNA U34 5-carboxymethylaminomethyl modifying GTPase MnmE/TrmE
MSTLYNNKYDILASTIQPNPTSVKYWADLSSNANGGDLKYFNGTKWVLVNNKATEDISQIKQQIADLEQNKEDKVEGKGLSTEDYTTQEKNKLASLQNYNDDEVRELISALNLRLTTLEGDYEALEARVTALETPAA